jgi:hypothetical protein
MQSIDLAFCVWKAGLLNIVFIFTLANVSLIFLSTQGNKRISKGKSGLLWHVLLFKVANVTCGLWKLVWLSKVGE